MIPSNADLEMLVAEIRYSKSPTFIPVYNMTLKDCIKTPLIEEARLIDTRMWSRESGISRRKHK